MKPIVLTKEHDGTVRMTIEEFKKYIDDAYEQGRSDAARNNWYGNWHNWYSSTTPGIAADSITISCSNADCVTNTL